MNNTSTMYGGLFGDLPSTKQSETKDLVSQSASELKSSNVPGISQDSTIKSQVLAGLGNAGTAMAFIPTAVRPRKKTKIPIKIKEVLMKTTEDQHDSLTAVESVEKQEDQSISFISENRALDISMKSSNVEILNQTSDSISSQFDLDNSTVKIVGDSTVEEAVNKAHSEQSVLLVQNNSYNYEDMTNDEANVTDPYDPHIPNDLLAYRERMAMQQERERLKREAIETLERQKQLRLQLEKERQRIEASGRAIDIIEHRTKINLSSNGRGRGINNLPAWLLKKQQEEMGTSESDNRQRTVVLSNLIAPGDIDNGLGEEVKVECEEQCGPVEKVEVKTAQPPLQPDVEVWVRFQDIGDAKKASKLFHGRLFGNRRVSARQQMA
jgi:hypothetical protein